MPNLVINGVSYPYPEIGSKPWAAKLIAWSQAVTAGMVQTNAGTFTKLTSATTHPADAGQIRLANGDVISWRNQANGANLDLTVNSSNDLLYATKKLAPLTTNGDLYVRSGGDNARLPVGANGTILSVVAGAPAWTSVAGTGDVVGAASSVDNTLPRFDGTSGKAIQTSGVVLDDSNAISKLNFKRTATATSAATAGEHIVAVTNTAAPRTITLSDVDKLAGRTITIKDESGGASANPITVIGESGDIDGEASYELNTNYGTVEVYSNGTDWFTKGGKTMISYLSHRAVVSGQYLSSVSQGVNALVTSGGPLIAAPGYDAYVFSAAIVAGMRVTGSGIASPSYVVSRDSDNQVTLDENATISSTAVVFTGYLSQTFTCTTTASSTDLTNVSSLVGLCVGQALTGANGVTGKTISSFPNGTTVRMSSTASGNGSGVSVSATSTTRIPCDITGLVIHQVLSGTGITAGAYISAVTDSGTNDYITIAGGTVSGSGSQSLTAKTGTPLIFSKTHQTLVKGSPGRLYYARIRPITAIYNTAALKLYDKATAPDQGIDTVVASVPYYASSSYDVPSLAEFSVPDGMPFANGIGYTLAEADAVDGDIHSNISGNWEVFLLYT